MAVRGFVVLDGRCALVLLIPHEYHTDRPLILWIGKWMYSGICSMVYVWVCLFSYSQYVYIYILYYIILYYIIMIKSLRGGHPLFFRGPSIPYDGNMHCLVQHPHIHRVNTDYCDPLTIDVWITCGSLFSQWLFTLWMFQTNRIWL